MLYTSLHSSRILHGPGHVEAWAMTPIIAKNRSLSFKALTQKTFPLNLSLSLAFQIQDFA